MWSASHSCSVARIRESAAASAGRELALAGNWLAANGHHHRLLGRVGHPEREIIAAAAEERADLIVIGAGLGIDPGPGAHPLGPLARFVVDHALCDVLVLRPPEPDEADWLAPGGLA
jgi:nucleotide-binding universal stress UspA family protein